MAKLTGKLSKIKIPAEKLNVLADTAFAVEIIAKVNDTIFVGRSGTNVLVEIETDADGVGIKDVMDFDINGKIVGYVKYAKPLPEKTPEPTPRRQGSTQKPNNR